MPTRSVFISVVCAFQDAEDVLEDRLSALTKSLRQNFDFYEIILIDNASQDRSQAVAQRLMLEQKNIQYCTLASPVSRSAALTAGLDRAIGDFVVILDLRQDPPAAIAEMIAQAQMGSEIVYGVSRERLHGRRLYDVMARIFLRGLARFNGLRAPPAVSSLRVFSRTVVTYILNASDCHRMLALAPALSGYNYATYTYDRLPGGPKMRRVTMEAAWESLELTFTTSVRPLRLVTFLSLGFSFASILYAFYVVAVRFFQSGVAPGWATLSLQMSLSFFILSVVLAVMCEYLLQTLESTKRRPVYHIAREQYSSAMELNQGPNVETRSAAPVETLAANAAQIVQR